MVAREIGQTSIDYQGKDFVYGNKGALEAYVGIWHIAERAKKIYSSAGKTLSDEDAVPYKLSAAADAGDLFGAGALVRHWSQAWGRAIQCGLVAESPPYCDRRRCRQGRRATDRQDQEHDPGTYRENVLGEPRDRSSYTWQ